MLLKNDFSVIEGKYARRRFNERPVVSFISHNCRPFQIYVRIASTAAPLFLFAAPALAHRLPAGTHGGEKRRRAPDAGGHGEGAELAILRAGAALDTEVTVDYERLFIAHSKYAARAHLNAPGAASALFRIKFHG
jgi:hypothetical protein